MAGGCTVSEEGGSTGEDVTGGGADAGSGSSASCAPSNVQQTVFTKCTGCHGANAPAAGLDLASAGVATRMVGVSSTCQAKPLVVAGDPAGSFLLEKLGSSPSCGAQMPKDGTPLSAEEFNCVSDWIQGLSPDTGGDGGGTGGGGTPPGGGGGGGGGGGW